MQRPSIELIDFSPRWQEDLVHMWRASFEFGVGITDPHPFVEQVAYFQSEILTNNKVVLAVSGTELVGFVAASRESVSQLHVRVGYHRQGIGSKMLAWAKCRSSGSLWLYTFARNKVAQAFYEQHGFAVAARGFEPEWQLEDIKYFWSAEGHGAA